MAQLCANYFFLPQNSNAGSLQKTPHCSPRRLCSWFVPEPLFPSYCWLWCQRTQTGLLWLFCKHQKLSGGGAVASTVDQDPTFNSIQRKDLMSHCCRDAPISPTWPDYGSSAQNLGNILHPATSTSLFSPSLSHRCPLHKTSCAKDLVPLVLQSCGTEFPSDS